MLVTLTRMRALPDVSSWQHFDITSIGERCNTRVLIVMVDLDLVGSLQSRDMPFVSWEDWLKLDEHERAAGAKLGKPRVKVCSMAGMLNVVAGT
jgi:hypothetical protein